MKEVQIFDSPAEVAQAALEFWVQRHQASSDFWVSLAGGSTPKELYRRLAGQSLDWSKLHLIWGDERFVAHDHPDSNYLMVRQTLLDSVASVGTSKPWSILDSAQSSAQEYESWLRQNRPQGVDLCLLGMGDDGHTASLFPGTRALQEKERLAVDNWVEKFNAPRLTLTYPYLNAAKEVLFLITGANKAQPFKEVLENHQHPTAGVEGSGATYYFLDREAAASLSWPPGR